jgi:hypothetical protein
LIVAYLNFGCSTTFNRLGSKEIIFKINSKHKLKHVFLYCNSDTIDFLNYFKEKTHFIVAKDRLFYELWNSNSLRIYVFKFSLEKDTAFKSRNIYFPLVANKDSLTSDLLIGSTFSFWEDLKFRITDSTLVLRCQKPRAWNTASRPIALEWVISRFPCPGPN